MNAQEVCEAVGEWVGAESNPTINVTYPYLPSVKAQLPDAVVELAGRELTREDDRFPHFTIQQAWVTTFSLAVSIMVENTNPPAAAEQLYDYSDQLQSALVSDSTLGGRVPFASPYLTFDFTAPFVEYPDGTRGREMNMTMYVGELVEAPG